MKNFLNNNKLYQVILLLLVIGSGGMVGCGDDEVVDLNTPPVAKAGPDREVPFGAVTILDGTGSEDADGDPLTYTWRVMSSPGAAQFELNNSTSVQARFSAETAGEYVITLTVEDGTDASAPDPLTITVLEDSNQAPTAIIRDENGDEIAETNNNNQVNVNSGFILSGAQSSDPDNDVLTFSWSVIDAPDGANPAFDNNSGEMVTFTPDLIGNYTVELKVADEKGAEGTAVVQIAAIGSPVIIDANVTAATTWTDVYDDPDLPDYRIVSSIDISAFLTVDPGVVIIIDENVSVGVSSNGALAAKGSASDSITFTSSDIDAGLRWKGLYINSSDARNSLEYVNLAWAGNSEFGFGPLNSGELAALGVDDNGKISISNSRFFNNAGYSAYFTDFGGELEEFSNNAFIMFETAIGLPANEVDALDRQTTFTDGSGQDVEILSTTYSEGNTSTWVALNNASYYVGGNISISGDLTIEAGARFEMDEDVFLSVDGSIDVNGTSSDHVIFTTANLAAQINWGGIFIESASALNSFDYAEILFAGGTTGGYGPFNTPVRAALGVDYIQYKVSLTNSIISGSEGYGLYVDDDGGELETFANNTFSDNLVAVGLPANEVDALDGASVFAEDNSTDVEIFSTTLSATRSSTWPALNDAEYFVSGNILIAGNLVVEAGAVFEMAEDVFWTVTGSLDVNGTQNQPVIFTTFNEPGQINWGGIFIDSSNALNSIDFAEIRYGGGASAGFGPISLSRMAALGIDSNSRMTLTNSVVSDSDGFGVLSLGETNDFQASEAGNTFINNVQGNGFSL